MSVRNLFVAALVLWLLMSGQSNAKSALPFNPHVKGFTLGSIIKGQDAIHAINKLHGMPMDIVEGIIVKYGDKHAPRITVWASEAISDERAQHQVNIMMQKMKSNPKSPFRHYRNWQEEANAIIGFEGMGQSHRVFQMGKWVYWISGDTKDIDDVIRHITKNP